MARKDRFLVALSLGGECTLSDGSVEHSGADPGFGSEGWKVIAAMDTPTPVKGEWARSGAEPQPLCNCRTF